MVIDSPRQRPNLVVTDTGAGTRRRRVFRITRSRLPLVFVFFLLVYVAFSLGTRFDQLYTMQRDLDAIQVEVEEIRSNNAGLQRQIELLQSDAYVEQVAREKLGLVKSGESRIVPVQSGSGGIIENNFVSDIKD